MEIIELKKRIIGILALLVLMILPNAVSAQDDDENKEGKDFYLNFMPNIHRSAGLNDSLYIFITTLKPAVVTIEAYSKNGTMNKEVLRIQEDKAIVKTYKHSEYELDGENFAYGIESKYLSQNAVKCGFHITSTEDIYVYGLTASEKSSDAMIVYPTTSLGKKYYVLTYNSDFNFDNQPTPSQFSIMATEDNTIVKINPSTITACGNDKEFSVTLQKGESYLVQAGKKRLGGGYENNDLTGTYIEADKNIAVFAGHQRATIPIWSGARNPSRDFICEQLIATETWGKDAFVVPFPYVEVDQTSFTDIYRIISSTDNNKVNVGGKTITLNKGQIHEGRITEPIAIYAERPIMTAQYKRTARLSNNNYYDTEGIGDPLMILVPPVEQFLKSASVYSVRKTENDFMDSPTFTKHYIVVVTPDSVLNDCILDGKNIPRASFKKINGSAYSYATMDVRDGQHTFDSKGKCGLYVYGYGYANSYGYTGGMRPRYLDVTNPDITKVAECYTHSVKINDDINLSYGLKTIELIDSLSANVRLKMDASYYKKKQHNAEIELIDRNKDGYYTLKVTDISKNISTISDTISGKTFSFANLSADGKIELTNISDYQQKCAKLIIHNTGLRIRTIENLNHTNTRNFSIPPSQFPLTIRPGEKKEIQICAVATGSDEKIQLDTIMLSSECADMSGIIKAEFTPFSTQLDTKCGLPVQLLVSSIPGNIFIEDVKVEPSGGIVSGNFGVDKDGMISIKLYDSYGKLIKEIYKAEMKAGIYSTNFSTADLSNGVYFLILNNSASAQASAKFLIIK